jgi:hypothetical protein
MVQSFGRAFFLVVALPILSLPVAGQSVAGLQSSGHGVSGDSKAIDDSWRRTSVGWERKEDWRYLTVSPVRRKLSLQTLVQKTWPATLATSELTLVLAILFLQPKRNGTDAKASD